jgi:opacity protein-like surface antigen
MTRLVAAALLAASLAPAAASAQSVDDDRLTLRPLVMGTLQLFSAERTFDAAFGQAHEQFFGGGLQVILKRRYFAEIVASRFRKTGQRAFVFNDEIFRLGFPMTVEITPLELLGGFRFDVHPGQRFVPYASAGIGTYRYQESSPTSDPGEDVDARHHGFIMGGGVEFRLHRWLRLGIDEQFSFVPGILGLAGVSKAAAENDLGGVAVRVKVVVGR